MEPLTKYGEFLKVITTCTESAATVSPPMFSSYGQGFNHTYTTAAMKSVHPTASIQQFECPLPMQRDFYSASDQSLDSLEQGINYKEALPLRTQTSFIPNSELNIDAEAAFFPKSREGFSNVNRGTTNQNTSFAEQVAESHNNTSDIFGNISQRQLRSLAEVFKIFNDQPKESEDKQVKRLLQLAPQFKLGQIQASLREFNIFFQLNDITKDSAKFKILQGRLPWVTMHQFGVQNSDCGPDFQKLTKFLLTYSGPNSPSLDQLQYINRFDKNSSFKDVHYAAVTASKLGQDELQKLFTYLFSTETMKPLVKSHLDLHLDQSEGKVSRAANGLFLKPA